MTDIHTPPEAAPSSSPNSRSGGDSVTPQNENLGGEQSSPSAEVVKRERLYLVEATVTERFYYDPEDLRWNFVRELAAWDGTFDDWVLSIFEEHYGSQFFDRHFHNDASPEVGNELVERWDDE